MRSKARSTFFLTLFAIFGAIGFIGSAAADDDRGNEGRLSAKAEIEELMSCYAYTFDAIARAVDATSFMNPLDVLDPINNSDPNFAEGYERFRSCTTEDFVIEILDNNGNPVLLEGDIPAGPLAWVNVVNFFDRLDGVTNQQHLFGSLSTTVHGRKGTLTAYASITTFAIEDGVAVTRGPGTSTYKSDVVYKRGKWLLKKTTLIEN